MGASTSVNITDVGFELAMADGDSFTEAQVRAMVGEKGFSSITFERLKDSKGLVTRDQIRDELKLALDPNYSYTPDGAAPAADSAARGGVGEECSSGEEYTTMIKLPPIAPLSSENDPSSTTTTTTTTTAKAKEPIGKIIGKPVLPPIKGSAVIHPEGGPAVKGSAVIHPEGGPAGGGGGGKRKGLWCNRYFIAAALVASVLAGIVVMRMYGGSGGARDDAQPTSAPTVGSAPAAAAPSPAVPISSPSSTPTSSQPSLAPTTTDTVSVDVSFEVQADTVPTADEEASMKSTVATSVGVSESSIEDFSITTSSRRLSLRALLSGAYTWSVSFTIRCSLAEVDDAPASPDSFSRALNTTLSSSTFKSSVVSIFGDSANIVVKRPSLVDIAGRFEPTSEPTPLPSPKPSQRTYVRRTIPEIQNVSIQRTPAAGEGCFASPRANEDVNVTGVVTAVIRGSHGAGFYMQEEGRSAPWSGIRVNTGLCAFKFDCDGTGLGREVFYNPEKGVGELVEVLGTVAEVNGTTQLASISSIRHLANRSIPAPLHIKSGTLGINCSLAAEAYEGVLVRVSNASVVSNVNQRNQIAINDGSGMTELANSVFDAVAHLSDIFGENLAGNFLGRVVGVVEWRGDAGGSFDVHTRCSNDLSGFTVPPSPAPTVPPTPLPTSSPWPTRVPTSPPTSGPTAVPSIVPSVLPTAPPTQAPSVTPTAVPTPVSYRALSALYEAANGSDWTKNSNWMDGDPCTASWYKVACTSGDVTKLQLTTNNLAGSIPTEIGLLSTLTINFKLDRNSLGGTIPTELGNMEELKYNFWLFSNELTGPIPSELGMITGMTRNFRPERNKLSGSIPTELGKWTKFTQSFYAFDNSITGTIPSELGEFTGLSYEFRIPSNMLTGTFPTQIGRLSLLTGIIQAQRNSIEGTLPTEIGNLDKLVRGFHVASYMAHANSFSGKIPTEIGRMRNFTGCIVEECDDGDVCNNNGDVCNLYQGFDMGSNSFRGSIPTQLGRLRRVNGFFGLESNLLCGSLPDEVAALSSQVLATDSGFWQVEVGNSLGTVCPTFAPTGLPTSTPAPSEVPSPLPSPVPTTSLPSIVPTPVPTSSPHPTPLPSRTPEPSMPPTPVPSEVPPVIIRPLFNQTTRLPNATKVRLAVSGSDEVFRLITVSSMDGAMRTAARSYAGNNWEAAPPLQKTDFDCGALRNGYACFTSTATADTDTFTYYLQGLRATEAFGVLDERHEASRFLAQATFGPTRESIAEFLADSSSSSTSSPSQNGGGGFGGDPEAWVRAQLRLEPSLLRERYRRRANPRMDVATAVAGVRTPCAVDSRWNRFAFTVADIGFTVTITELSQGSGDATSSGATYQNSAPGVSLAVSGVVRTETLARNFNVTLGRTSINGSSVVVCAVEEAVGGDVIVGQNCDNIDDDATAAVVTVPNPLVNFSWSGSVPDASRVVITATSAGAFSGLEKYRGTVFGNELGWNDPPPRADVLLLVESTAGSGDVSCDLDSLPGGPLFALWDSGGQQEVLIHDRRAELLVNSLEAPLTDSSTAGSCPVVPKTFQNIDSCVANSRGCSNIEYTSSRILLNETMLRMFYDVCGVYVHYITGLRMDYVESPCTTETSRWVRRDDHSVCTASAGTLDNVTESVLRAALTSGSDKIYYLLGATSNARVRDISIGDGDCVGEDEVVGTAIFVNDTNGLDAGVDSRRGCWQHVHEDEYGVYDFSLWTVAHPGNEFATAAGRPNPITAFAAAGSAAMIYPGVWHDMSRWATGDDDLTPLGRLDDVIDFASLPTAVQCDAMAKRVGAVGARADAGHESCGSPGEVANDPSLRNAYSFNMGDNQNPVNVRPLDYLHVGLYGSASAHDKSRHKEMVWYNTALHAPDQLRHRVAWALNQIFVVSVSGVAKGSETEFWLVWYDIFVRHAFGNYKDVLREVSYSPTMAKMLTYMYGSSLKYSGTYPDENYAREVMQLFTIGLWELHTNGTQVLDANGDPISTYDNDDIMSFARVWTGFAPQADRANYEIRGIAANFVDPMQLQETWRDFNAKHDLVGGFIGDGTALCVDLPPRPYLRKGATYRYLGTNPLPTEQSDPTDYDDDAKTFRFELDKNSSALYAALCNANVEKSSDCRFRSQIILPENLNCVGDMECAVDVPRVVQLNATLNGTRGAWYYEYVERPCVRLNFFENGTQVTTRGGNSWESYPICTEAELPAAAAACCSWAQQEKSNTRAYPECEFFGERMTKATAQGRCLSSDYTEGTLCDFFWMSTTSTEASCDVTNAEYYWTTKQCGLMAQIAADGKIIVVHDAATDSSSAFIGPDTEMWIKVNWNESSYPTVADGGCRGDCIVHNSEYCLCNTTTVTAAVFGSLPLPTRAEIVASLKIGAFDPAIFDDDTYTKCATAACTARNPNVTVYSRGVAAANNLNLDEETIFEIKDQTGASTFYKNQESTVQIRGGPYSFRNPPSFMAEIEPTVRDAKYETEAVLEAYMNHQNTPPFVATRLLERFGYSNPSPRFVEIVATAFIDGRYGQFGNGTRGDLGATVAAILLDREAREAALDVDPGHGSLKEPFLKLLHLMRSMEFKPALYYEEVELKSDLMSQMVFGSETVFNFYQSDFQPPGGLSTEGLVSPEAQIITAPNLITWLNGAVSLIKWGLTDCDKGFHNDVDSNSCWRITSGKDDPSWTWAGNLSYSPRNGGSSKETVADLDLLLTGGRLSNHSRAVIEAAHKETYAATGGDTRAALKVAQQLFVVSPEFQTNNHANLVTKTARTTKAATASSNSSSSSSSSGSSSSSSSGSSSGTTTTTTTEEKRPYKAIVYLFLNGAADSFNMLVPYSDCDQSSSGDGLDMREQYESVRDGVVLETSQLLAVNASDSDQPCKWFGIHPDLGTLHASYQRGESSWVANIGTMVEPITKAEYQAKTKDFPPSLFAHNLQTRLTQNVHAQEVNKAKGIIGRIQDKLTTAGVSTGSYSISGNPKILEPQGEISPLYDVVDQSKGVETFDDSLTSQDLLPAIANLTRLKSDSLFSEEIADLVENTLARSGILAAALDAVELEQDFAAGGTTIGKQLNQVARLIRANQQTLGDERNAFYVSLGGFDLHTDLTEGFAEKLTQVDAALASFEAEMRLQGLWDNVTVVQASEFGRTLTCNGLGTDHAWGGNVFLYGGSIRGGRVHGRYPSDLTEAGDYNIGRGRLLPTMPWESLWHAVAQWFGIEDGDDMAEVLPNLGRFPPEEWLNETTVFK